MVVVGLWLLKGIWWLKQPEKVDRSKVISNNRKSKKDVKRKVEWQRQRQKSLQYREYTKPKTGMKRKEVGDVFLSREEENARRENRENVKREKEQQAGKQERNHFKEGNIV